MVNNQDSKSIPLTQGMSAIVDAEDYDQLMQFKWYTLRSPRNGPIYARRSVNQKGIYMHRAIMQPADHLCVDHINRNTLDNRKVNLRICTHAENMMNQRASRYKWSDYKGVVQVVATGKWRARIKHKKQIHLGMFLTEIEAAKAYDDAAKLCFGKFAKLNFPDGI